MKCEDKYDITGMSCAACSARVDKEVRGLKGVEEVNVNLLTNSMVVKYDKNLLSQKDIEKSVSNAGYEASLHKEKSLNKEDLSDKQTPRLLKRLIVSLVLLGTYPVGPGPKAVGESE